MRDPSPKRITTFFISIIRLHLAILPLFLSFNNENIKNMKPIFLILLYCTFVGLCFGADQVEGENLAVNGGSFDSGIEGWSATRRDTIDGELKTVPAPEFISYVEDDGVGTPKGCLKVTLADVSDDCTAWTSGAIMKLTNPVPEDTKVKISFYAKGLQGAVGLVVARSGGGGFTDAVELTDQWQQYDLFFSSKFETPYLVFSLRDRVRDRGHIENGEFLLDQVSVQVVTAP